MILKAQSEGIQAMVWITPEVGGAPLLGINGGVIKAHGSSNAAAMKNAIRQGMLYLKNGVLERIQSAVTATVENKL